MGVCLCEYTRFQNGTQLQIQIFPGRAVFEQTKLSQEFVLGLSCAFIFIFLLLHMFISKSNSTFRRSYTDSYSSIDRFC